MSYLTCWAVLGSAAAVLSGTVVVRAQLPRPAARPTVPPPIDFARDIQPVLEQSCYECHGRSKARGQLRLHAPQFLRKGGQSGAIVLPGKGHESLIIRRLLDENPDDRMPLDGDPLPEATIARLRAWIDQGALMNGAPFAGSGALDAADVTPGLIDEHWSYVKPSRPPLPEVGMAAWVRTPIDRFVLARLEEERLSPSPPAAAAALLRRVSLDLTGLPPTLEEIDSFLGDRSADAYEKVVDRLLASPHYGERWARPWLDLARYADTNGYEKDNRRTIWKYRDWVIDALNRDLPFDQFTIQQLAGDMLPNATDTERIASGFHRNAMTNEEGGVDPDESRYEVLVDRVNTTATVWLGSTLACAQCHNHKYDPFTQKDYFRLLAFFANSDFESRTFGDGTRYSEPTLDLATAEQDAARKKIQADIDRLEQTLKAATPEAAEAQASWEEGLRAVTAAWTPLTVRRASATSGVTLTPQPDGSLMASGPNPSLTSYTLEVDTPLERVTGLRIEALPDPSLPRGGPGRDAYGHFRVTGIAVDARPLADPSQPPLPVRFESARVNDSAAAFDARLFLGTAAGRSSRRGAWAINAMRDTERLPRHVVLGAATPFGFPGGTSLRIVIDHLDGTIGQGLGRLRLSASAAADPLMGAELSARVRRRLETPVAARTAAEAEEVAAAFRSVSPLLQPTRDALAATRKALADLQIPSTLVMRERPTFERPSYELRQRGSFAAKGERVYAATPGTLHPMAGDQPINRLGLARWLVDEDNPLVARVAVNRLWEQIFGRGLVETSEDFGTQGAPPSHPALLDWLASEFVANRWSQKALLRTIVLSATYRQGSAVPPGLADRDPYNRLLARGPRVRLEAEMIRDVTLAASGLLSRKLHGPSVFPPQPEGIWNMPFSSDRWTESAGEDRYRRSVYTFWRRTSPYPSLMTFDATSRELCTVRRVRTNTPLQALTLLNDPASFEAARALARRMAAARPDARAGAALGLTLVLSRAAQAVEIDRLVALYAGERAHYRSRTDAAARVAYASPSEDPADLAAWTIVANALLNLDEAVTKQ